MAINHEEEIMMNTPVDRQDVHPKGYPVRKAYLHMEVNLSNQSKTIATDKELKYDIQLKKPYIDLFDTGVATVTLQFKLKF